MSIMHVRHISAALERLFNGRIDLSDYAGRPESERNQCFLSRSLAAYSLTRLADIEPEVAASFVVDGYDDNGIDAVYFDQDDRTVYVVQSKWISSGDGSPEIGAVQSFIQGFKDLIEARFTRFNQKMVRHQGDISAALDDPLVKFTLVIAYTGQQGLSIHAQRAFQDLLEELNDPTEVVTLHVLSQAELHRAVSDEAEGAPINLEVAIQDWGQRREPYQAYYGQVNAGDVASWWQAHQNRLFARNLRKFIGSTDVNQSLIATLRTEPEKFWYYNNGVTVLCNKVTKKPIGGADKTSGYFLCEGVSVVNGAQTVGTVASVFDTLPESVRRAWVTVRFISLEEGPEDFATSVTRATNTQNRIERRDFVALDPEQQRLRSELWAMAKEYAYKSGEPAPPPEKGCSVDEATSALACANPDLALAVQAKREIGKLWENIEKPPYKLLFSSGLSGLRLWRTVEVMRAVDSGLKEQQDLLEGRDRMVAVHGNRLILHQVFKGLPVHRFDDPNLDFDSVRADSRVRSVRVLDELREAVANLFPTSYLNSLFKNLSKCRELVGYSAP